MLTCQAFRRITDLMGGMEVCFDYTNPHENRPGRVGMVEGWCGSIETENLCLRLWDYSLIDGPGYRSYRIEYIINLAIIVTVPDNAQPRDSLGRFRENIEKFRRKLGGK
jgi:hypothetical protein